MSKNVSRRAMLAGAAPTLAAAAAPDPIFAAIERHRTAHTRWLNEVKVQGDLEEQIPSERCENYHSAHRDDPTVGVNDDPRWTAHRKVFWAATDEMDAAATELVTIRPTTIAGITALLAYYIEKVGNKEHEHCWPETLVDDDEPSSLPLSGEHPWHVFMVRQALQALTAISA